MKKIYAIIPAAGFARDSLGQKTNTPTALKRILGKPMILKIIETLEYVGVENFVIGIDKNFLNAFNRILKQNSLRSNIQFISVDPQKEVMSTLQSLVKNVPDDSSTLINCGDTSLRVDPLMFQNDYAIYTSSDYPGSHWSRVLVDSSDFAQEFVEKGEEFSKKGLQILCGVYWFKHTAILKKQIVNLRGDSPISAVFDPEATLISCINSQDWIDSDHLDMFEKGRNRLLESRAFNNLEVNIDKNQVKKSSKNSGKLLREIRFYKNLPIELREYFPEMISYRIFPKVSQTLEYIASPTLSEIMLYEIVSREQWEMVFSRLANLIYEQFSKFGGKDNHDLSLIFYKKVLERNNALLERAQFYPSFISNNHLEVNGVNLPTLRHWKNDLLSFFETISSPTVFTHGDFCATNIFVDIESFRIRLIDPRGGFENSRIFGPQIYDVAKLAHSIIGNYDLILADRFVLKNCEGKISFEVYTDEYSQLIEEVFWSNFVSKHYKRREILICTGLIMLGIPIFHLNDPARAHAMYIRGLQLIQQGFTTID